MSKEKIGRIGGDRWMFQRAQHVTAIYNADYNENGQRVGIYDKPWTATGKRGSGHFTTHAEALAWAFEKAEAGK